jgi:hypothetical protein
VGTGVLSQEQSGLGMKLTTHLASAKVNEWSYASTPPVCLCGMDMDNFNFLYCVIKFLYV